MKKLLTILFASVFWGAYAQNTNYNYIEERTYTDEAATEAKALTAIVYYDGLGRPVQEVQKGASPVDGQDIIKHIEYEPNIGQVKDYLPYAGSGVNFATNALQETLSFYNSWEYENTTNPYSENRLEASPRQRVLESAAPGADWAMDASEKHTIRSSYSLNSSRDAVQRYTVTTTWNASRGTFVSSIANNGNYPAKTLHKTIVKNENWKSADGRNNTTEEFKDLKGNIVLKRTYNSGVAHDTYYVYDNYGNLSYVLPPLANGAITSTTLDKLCYQYRYDEKNRLVEKKLPGKEWEYIVYDQSDRVVMTGPVYSPFGSGSKGWLFTKYDAFSRPVYTGYYNGHSVTAANRKAIKDLVYAQANCNETKTTANQTVDGVAIRYTNTKFPTSSIYMLTVNYYDDYNFPNAPTSFPSIGGVATVQTAKGLPTGSWTRVVTTTAERKATLDYTLYNAKYQPLRTYTKNHLGGYTQTDSELTFTGLPTKTTTQHRYDSNNYKGSVISIVDNYTYDQQERLIRHTQKTGSQPEQLITENVYDALGTLVTKNVGGLETATDPLQKVDYKYNVRGWLTDINSVPSGMKPPLPGTMDSKDLFNYRINYNQTFSGDDDTKAQYNGNISSLAWHTRTDNQVRGYAYDYDHLNRLNYASHLRQFEVFNGGILFASYNYSRTGQYAEDLTYDKNGNILSLDRYGQEELGQPIQIDELTYTYDGNRLLKVADATNNPDGFKDGSNTGNDYTYDTMGNLKTDQNKGITSVKYNHLNLPTEVVFNTGKISYTYDAIGTRVGKKVEPTSGTTVTTDYLDGFQYENFQLKFFHQPEGFVEYKLVNSGSLSYYTYIYHYIYKDHLGNNRLTYADLDGDGEVTPGEIIEENNYYPFGLRHKGYNELATENPSGFKYKFGGKELNDELGFEVYDFGARNYDPALGRWMNIDPLAEEMRRFSPYNYAFNNPIVFIDPDGMKPLNFNPDDLDDIITINLETETIDIVDAPGNDVVNFVDKKGEVKDSYEYGKNGSFKKDFKNLKGQFKDGRNFEALITAENNKAHELFEFIAKNSDVEFEKLRMGKSEGYESDISIIGTTFEESKSGFGSNTLKFLEAKGFDLKSHWHNHPNGTVRPSGYNKDGTVDLNYTHGDAPFARNRIENYEKAGKKPPVYYIIPRGQAKFTEYDGINPYITHRIP
ncbi:DUF6443 domain-containing protein [Avrilella dinanensis]|uniref:DUF6443 domain-containing protein n=1 Tax=Avrilella dinanensis TaxID=2008672 RepID=UPI00240A7DFB|nr:DUF6443 domain-containing protein [Avrilella dinanensis]